MNGRKTAAGNKPSRLQLELELDMHRQAQGSEHGTNHYIDCNAYSPCTKAFGELSPITFADLTSETHHRGKVLFIRTIDDAVRAAGLSTIIEDETDSVERLIFYHSDVAAKAEDILPPETTFAVKEPYYTRTPEGHYSIRVDHPSNLVHVDSRNPLVPQKFQADSSGINKPASELKQEGNLAYKKGNYQAAIRAYSQSLYACAADDVITKRDILRNRAIANTYLRRLEAALADAKDSIIPDTEACEDKGIALNAKAHFRAGRAAYELGHFREAQTCFQRVKDLTPTDADAAAELERTEARLQEEATGAYDFLKMSKSASRKHNKLDHANFSSKTTVRETEGRGRGLFAATDLKAGELIMCEKAFSVAFDLGKPSKTYTILEHNSKRASTGTQAILLFDVVQKCLYNQGLAAEVYNLFGGDPESTTEAPVQLVDGVVPVDVFRVQSILGHNSFACPSVRSSSETTQKPAGSSSTGLWVRAAYTNHACDGNAMRSFIGDMIMLRASKDIAKGEEILMPYRLPEADNAETQKDLEKTWGFRCDCELCKAEAATSTSLRKERSELLKRTAEFCSANPPGGKKHTTQLEKLRARLEKTYDDKMFHERPRLGLIIPGLWFCESYKRSAPPDKVIGAAIAVLRDLGFIVSIAEQEINIERRYCQVQEAAIQAAMYAAHALNQKGDAGLAKQMDEFARGLYQIMNGETRGFEDRYGKL